MSTLKVGGLTHREVLKNAERLEIEAAARRAGAEQMRERAARETDYAVAYHPPLSGSSDTVAKEMANLIAAAIRALPVE